MVELFTLPGNAVVQAGAGTGKTHSLVTLCLHLLGGVGRPEPLAPARLCAVTFTEKAAAELKGRLRQRVDKLAQGLCDEPDLVRTAQGALPPVDLWRRVRRDLGLAQIGTIHSLCAQILRRHVAVAGLDPSFALLDEVDSRRLLHDSCDDTVLQALDGRLGAEPAAAARRLCAEFGFRGGGKFGAGLADELAGVVASLGESGRDLRALVEATGGLSLARAEAGFAQARAAVPVELAALEAALREKGAASASGQKATDALAAFRAAGAAALSAAQPGRLALSWQPLRAVCAALVKRGNGVLPDAIGAAAKAFDALCEADAGVRACGLARDLAALVAAAVERHRLGKTRASALDFDDLTRLARDVLVHEPSVRASEQARLGVLLIDEFQDTSRTQLELFSALASAPLAVVGDRKQSIYEFRGADVAGAQAFAARLVEGGAGTHVLRESRRSRPALVSFANLLFERVLSAGDHPFDTQFGPADALTAFRPAGPAGPCAELVDVAGPGVEAEAEAVARRIAALLSPAAPERVYDGDTARPLRGGDIAILLRRFTNVEAFRRALLACRIPHLVLKGKGFHEAREVLDLLALLALACDPDDALALATVLRSPLGPVSDDGLVLLARAPHEDGPGRGLDRRSLTDPAVRAVLAPDDAEAVDRLARLLAGVQREVDRLGPSALLEAVVAATDFVAAHAGGLYGEQAAANIDKLIEQARAHELSGGTVRTFLARMTRLVDEEAGEAFAPVVEERDPHAVRILTVHAAKGLEFPVVVLPECAALATQSFSGNVLLDPDLGVAVKVRGVDGARRWGPHGSAVKERRQQRDVAQSRRLFYVAATRARDLLLLSGRAAGKAESWRGHVDKVRDEALALGLLRVTGEPGASAAPLQRSVISQRPELARELFAGALPAALDPLGGEVARADSPPPVFARPAVQRPEPVDRDSALADSLGAQRVSRTPATADPEVAGAVALVERAVQHAPPQTTVSIPVTQLADAVVCARRYQLLHELRLEERPDPEPELPDPLGPEADAPVTSLGTLAHRLLEFAPLSLQGDRLRAALDRLVTLEGHDPEACTDVVEAVVRFVESPLAKRMAAAPEGRLRRELPFMLRVPGSGSPELLVRGQLDALLLDDGGATVIDYKLSRARDVEAYSRQLDTYALAAHALVEGAVPVRTGIVFLRSPGAPWAERPAPDAPALEQIRSSLVSAGQSLARGRQTGEWPRIDPAKCAAISCGFLRRCHPGASEGGDGRPEA